MLINIIERMPRPEPTRFRYLGISNNRIDRAASERLVPFRVRQRLVLISAPQHPATIVPSAMMR